MEWFLYDRDLRYERVNDIVIALLFKEPPQTSEMEYFATIVNNFLLWLVVILLSIEFGKI